MSAFGTDDFPPPSLEEMAARELAYNRKYLPQETPCQTFYKLEKGTPLSIFIEVYPFNELVDCGSNFQLEELMELKRLYSTLDRNDQEFYIDSFRRLQEVINSIQANKIPGSYGKGFQSWKEQKEEVAANKEIRDVLRMPEPSQKEIDEIAFQHYLKDEIPLPPSPQPVQPAQPTSLIGRIKSFFSGGGRKTVKLIKSSRSRSNSRRSKSRSRSRRSKSNSRKSNSRSKSQSKKVMNGNNDE